VLLTIVIGFRGVIVGSVLGDTISVQVRAVDVIAVATIVLLGVCDVLYLNLRDRASELAVLRATGWSNRDITTLSPPKPSGSASPASPSAPPQDSRSQPP
jgi:putative ABC transport system permease protein